MSGTPGPLERYRDLLFDLLSGTGPAGRRALAEADAHLHECTQALERDGRDRERAARSATAT
jgi:hypothetical protein